MCTRIIIILDSLLFAFLACTLCRLVFVFACVQTLLSDLLCIHQPVFILKERCKNWDLYLHWGEKKKKNEWTKKIYTLKPQVFTRTIFFFISTDKIDLNLYERIERSWWNKIWYSGKFQYFLFNVYFFTISLIFFLCSANFFPFLWLWLWLCASAGEM